MKCKCGCGEETNIAAISNSTISAGEPYTYILGHHLRKANKYKINSKTGCWDWQLYTNENGYGCMWCVEKERDEKAHIVFYERAKGKIPKGKEVHHVCENHACVNPDHLEVLTKAEHLRKHKAILTLEEVRDIRNLTEKKISARKLAKMFNISRGAIRGIIKNRTWKGVK